MNNNPAGAHADALSVYAGPRSDPFFIDLRAFQEAMASGELVFSEPGTNSLAGVDALGLVVEADCAPLLAAGRGPLFAVVAETVVLGSPGSDPSGSVQAGPGFQICSTRSVNDLEDLALYSTAGPASTLTCRKSATQLMVGQFDAVKSQFGSNQARSALQILLRRVRHDLES
jgi:hypothetical protein